MHHFRDTLYMLTHSRPCFVWRSVHDWMANCSPLATAVQRRTSTKNKLIFLVMCRVLGWYLDGMLMLWFWAKCPHVIRQHVKEKKIEEIRFGWRSYYFQQKNRNLCAPWQVSAYKMSLASLVISPDKPTRYTPKASFQLGIELVWLTHSFSLIVLLWRETLGLFNIMLRILNVIFLSM